MIFIIGLIGDDFSYLDISTEENTESIPRTNKVRKNKIDQSHWGVIVASACGYATKINSGPLVANSSTSCPTMYEMCPRTEKIIKPDISEVRLLTTAMKKVSLLVV